MRDAGFLKLLAAGCEAVDLVKRNGMRLRVQMNDRAALLFREGEQRLQNG